MHNVGICCPGPGTNALEAWFEAEACVDGIRLRSHAGSRKLQELKRLFPEADISLY